MFGVVVSAFPNNNCMLWGCALLEMAEQLPVGKMQTISLFWLVCVCGFCFPNCSVFISTHKFFYLSPFPFSPWSCWWGVSEELRGTWLLAGVKAQHITSLLTQIPTMCSITHTKHTHLSQLTELIQLQPTALVSMDTTCSPMIHDSACSLCSPVDQSDKKWSNGACWDSFNLKTSYIITHL